MKNSFKQYRIDTLIKIAKTTSDEVLREQLLAEANAELNELTEQKGIEVDSISLSEYAGDEIKTAVYDYLRDKNEVCCIEIWQNVFGKSGKPTKDISIKIGNIITEHGWIKTTPRRNAIYGVQRMFRREGGILN